MSTIYFHEDDYCMIEILPKENYEFSLQQVEKIDELAEEHHDGVGYTDIFVRDDGPVSLFSMGIAITLFDGVMRESFPQFDEVFAEYGSYSEKCENVRAFGIDHDVALFCDEKNGIVDHIWLMLYIRKDSDISMAHDIFRLLSNLGEFIIADWEWSFIEEVTNVESLDLYLRKRFEVFTSIPKKS